MAYYYQPSGAPSFTPLPQGMNKYWIPHKDIHKRVIMTNIQYYLGREATVRSYTKDGEDGFLITTPGACLTDDQIDDICNKSDALWKRQADARAGRDSPTRMQLKRPLHQPVVIARANTGRRAGDRDRDRDVADRSDVGASADSQPSRDWRPVQQPQQPLPLRSPPSRYSPYSPSSRRPSTSTSTSTSTADSYMSAPAPTYRDDWEQSRRHRPAAEASRPTGRE